MLVTVANAVSVEVIVSDKYRVVVVEDRVVKDCVVVVWVVDVDVVTDNCVTGTVTVVVDVSKDVIVNGSVMVVVNSVKVADVTRYCVSVLVCSVYWVRVCREKDVDVEIWVVSDV